jgi:glutaminase
MDLPSGAEETERPYISTGHLPEPEMVQRLVSDAHLRFKSNNDGQNSKVYPALARVPRELFASAWSAQADGSLALEISSTNSPS